jgi:hypothetical protein
MRKTSDSVAFLPISCYLGSYTFNTASKVAADRGAGWRSNINMFPIVRKKSSSQKDDVYTNL